MADMWALSRDIHITGTDWPAAFVRGSFRKQDWAEHSQIRSVRKKPAQNQINHSQRLEMYLNALLLLLFPTVCACVCRTGRVFVSHLNGLVAANTARQEWDGSWWRAESVRIGCASEASWPLWKRWPRSAAEHERLASACSVFIRRKWMCF